MDAHWKQIERSRTLRQTIPVWKRIWKDFIAAVIIPAYCSFLFFNLPHVVNDFKPSVWYIIILIIGAWLALFFVRRIDAKLSRLYYIDENARILSSPNVDAICSTFAKEIGWIEGDELTVEKKNLAVSRLSLEERELYIEQLSAEDKHKLLTGFLGLILFFPVVAMITTFEFPENKLFRFRLAFLFCVVIGVFIVLSYKLIKLMKLVRVER